MTTYDFYVTSSFTDGDTITLHTEKRNTNTKHLLQLDYVLANHGVDGLAIGQAIESLERLPYGVAQTTVQGKHNKIIINQNR